MKRSAKVKRVRKPKKKAIFNGNIHHSDGVMGLNRDQIDLDRRFGDSNMMLCKHHVDKGPITQTATAPNSGALVFTISDINDNANYLAVFDEYQIAAIKVRFIARQNAIPGFSSSTYNPGTLVTALDFDDSANPGLPGLYQYNTCVETGAFESVIRAFKPKVSIATYGNGVVTNYTQYTPDKKLGWCDNQYSQIVHNGLKYAITAGATSQTLLSTWTVFCTYYVKWRRNI
jgi:ribosomal protein S14